MVNPFAVNIGRRGERLFAPAFCWLAWLLLLPGLSVAETPQQVVNPKKAYNAWVSDMAGVIDDEIERQLNALIDELERTTTAEIAVVTVKRTDGRTPKEFATELFNRWGIGKKGKDNGVLVLLVMEERRIEVETGYGMEAILPDGKVGAILDEYVIPLFKQGDFGGGLLAGVRAMGGVIAGKPLTATPLPQPKAMPMPSPAPTVYVPSAPKLTFPFLPFGFAWVLLLPFLMLIGYAVWRSGVRYCPKCRRQMRRLTEEQDDAYLAFDQKFEEELGGVDYRVWRCDDCQTLKIERAVRWLSSYEDCPECGHRTVYVASHTVREPTYERSGLEEIVRTCRFPKCSYHTVTHRPIRRLERSTSSSWSFSSGQSSSSGWSSGGGWSSSSSSFGGGSSGGGGAGRSW